MSALTIVRARSYAEAGALLRNGVYSLPVLKAGGMDVVDHMKEGLLEPDALIDIRTLRAEDGPTIRFEGRRLRIDASVTLADLATSDLLREHAPALAESAESAATPQVRNVASVGGNLLQRPRCWYYRNEQFNCLKKGGSTCFAVDGENKFHAIFGAGPCHIVHPSNIAPPLFTMRAIVHLAGSERAEMPITDLFHSPDKGVRTEHALLPGEVITHVTCEPAARSGFAVVKEKQSFDWPLVFAVATLDLQGRRISGASVCAGAVAPIPWPLESVAGALAGVDIGDEPAIRAACDRAVEGAHPMSQNAYKLTLLPVVVRRAVMAAATRGDG